MINLGIKTTMMYNCLLGIFQNLLSDAKKMDLAEGALAHDTCLICI